MKIIKILLLGFFAFGLTPISHSQTNNMSIDLNLPFPAGDNFIGKNYRGVADVGIKYHFIGLSKFHLGLSGNIGLLRASEITDINVVMIKPKISGEVSIWRLKPYIGAGYSIFRYYLDSEYSEGLDTSNDGFNLNVGLKFSIISKLYLNLGYDFIKFRQEKFKSVDYNRNIQILETGIGVQF